MWSPKIIVNKIFPFTKHKPKVLVASGNFWSLIYSFRNHNEENTFGAAMVIFRLTNKIQYKHHWKTMTNELNASHICSFLWQPNVSSQLYLLLSLTFREEMHPTKKLPFGSLIYDQNNLSFRVLRWQITMLLTPATKVQHFLFQSPELPAIHLLWENRWKSMAAKLHTDHSWKCCGRFIITGKSVLYFKSSRKVKSKWPIGGQLWILL